MSKDVTNTSILKLVEQALWNIYMFEWSFRKVHRFFNLDIRLENHFIFARFSNQDKSNGKK